MTENIRHQRRACPAKTAWQHHCACSALSAGRQQGAARCKNHKQGRTSHAQAHTLRSGYRACLSFFLVAARACRADGRFAGGGDDVQRPNICSARGPESSAPATWRKQSEREKCSRIRRAKTSGLDVARQSLCPVRQSSRNRAAIPS